MSVQRVAQLFGLVFIAVGVLGFFTTGMDMTADPVTAPKLLGQFPINAAHNIVHIVIGVWGLLAARSWAGARSFATIAGSLYLALAGLGLVVPDMFGLLPIGGNDVWLHALVGAILAGVGFTAKQPVAAGAR
jgi:uncharacterized protein DUF4383